MWSVSLKRIDFHSGRILMLPGASEAHVEWLPYGIQSPGNLRL